jgi:hypothetical protein
VSQMHNYRIKSGIHSFSMWLPERAELHISLNDNGATRKVQAARLISQETESNDSINSPSRALIGGVQPNMVGGPLWQRYINRGGGQGSQYEVHRDCSRPTDTPPLPI